MKKFISLLLSTITILSTLVILTTSASADSYVTDNFTAFGNSITLDVGKKVDLSYLFSKSDKSVEFATSNNKVAKIVKSNGKRYVKAVNEGKATIWAIRGKERTKMYIRVKNYKSKTCKFTVDYYFTESAKETGQNTGGKQILGDGSGVSASVHFKANISNGSDGAVTFLSTNYAVTCVNMNNNLNLASFNACGDIDKTSYTKIYAISSSGEIKTYKVESTGYTNSRYVCYKIKVKK